MKKLLFIILSLGFFLNISSVQAESNLILFWGDGCPHCTVVKEEINEKGYNKMITIDYKEIYNNSKNARLFDEKIKECGISEYNAGVPMVYVNGTCWIGQYDAIYAIEKEIGRNNYTINTNDEDKASSQISIKSENINNIKNEINQEETAIETSSNKGQQNTQLMLVSILFILIALVGVGYAIENKKSKTLNIILLILSLGLISIFSVQPIYAVCPVCTVAVGAGLGLSRYLGIDDLITSIWIGGLIVSTIYWIIDWINKRNKKGLIVDILTIILTYVFVLIPLYWGGIIGHPFNTFWGIDKIILGTVIGSIAFFLGANIHFYLKKQNQDKVFIPFQKVVIPVGALWLISLIFYLIIY